MSKQEISRENIVTPVFGQDAEIINAAVLKAEDVATKRVRCPACGEKVFAMWPEGWDAHAAHRCSGLTSTTQEDRKQEFKSALRRLFVS